MKLTRTPRFVQLTLAGTLALALSIAGLSAFQASATPVATAQHKGDTGQPGGGNQDGQSSAKPDVPIVVTPPDVPTVPTAELPKPDPKPDVKPDVPPTVAPAPSEQPEPTKPDVPKPDESKAPEPKADPPANQGDVQNNPQRRHHRDRPPPPVAQPPALVTCSLAVPPAPLTAAGLATPYVLGNGCTMSSPTQAAFVEASVYDPATNTVSVYRPLVVDKGTVPAAAPVLPVLPARAVVGLWFGFQGDVLTLTGPGARGCVNGLKGSKFGQFAYCNAPQFFQAARNVVAPALGVAKDGLPCPTTRDFAVVDQDQSDNVTTTYRILVDGRTAQDTAANAALGVRLVNGSDNGLLNRKINPALGCASFTGPDLADPGKRVSSLGLNELSARLQLAPVALVPTSDPMTQVDGNASVAKAALYRVGVGQPLRSLGDRNQPKAYCAAIKGPGAARVELDKPFTVGVVSPDPAMNLYDFLKARLQATLMQLGCK